MAITLTAGEVDTGGGTGRSITPTVPSGAELFYVGQTMDDSGVGKDFSQATYDSNNMTSVVNSDDNTTDHRPAVIWSYDVSGRTLPESITVNGGISDTDQSVFSGIAASGSGITQRGSAVTVRGSTASTSAAITIPTTIGDTVLVYLAWDGVTAETDVTKSSGQTLVTGTAGIASMLGAFYSFVATGTSTTLTFTKTGSNVYGLVGVALYEGSAVTVTDVDTDETITNGQTGIVITGTNFGATQGSGTVTIGGVAQTVTAWADTSITITHVLGTMAFGTNSLVVTNNSSDTGNLNVTVNPASGKSYVTLTSVASSGQRITAVADLVAGDQLEYDNTTTPDSSPVAIAADGTFTITDSDPSGESFDVRAWDSGTPGWGTAATQTVSSVDVTPDAFTFTDITDQEVSTQVTSNSITVLGVDSGNNIPISITGGDYSVNSGAFTSTAGNVQLNDTVRVRHTTSSSYGTAVNTTLTIGGVNDTFTSTTSAQVSPTNIVLTSQPIGAKDGANTVVGTLSTVDANVQDTHTYSLVAGAGDTDNSSFNINNDQLRANDVSALGSGTYSVRVQTTDGSSTPFAKSLSVEIAIPGTGGASAAGTSVGISTAQMGISNRDTSRSLRAVKTPNQRGNAIFGNVSFNYGEENRE